ncbi:SIMPL domain-containing protein [Salinicola aestuarinus]|uniref:SIMPL domain-containing protein n=1 Tax=Salinicola aestuarinus TaxID=1949082 RepID=UPI000DA1E5A0|nr:SIMPL domain-containing protein [Salinicola aestuarinus]
MTSPHAKTPASQRPLPRFAVLTASAALLSSIVMSAPALAEPTPPQIRVQASATLEKAPDTATLNARLWERTPTRPQGEAPSGDSEAVGDARARLESRVDALIRTLEDAGVPAAKIRAGSLSVRPDIIQSGGNEGDPAQVRTQVERPVSLTLDQLDRLPQVLDALTAAGVDSLDGVSYGLQTSDDADDEALQKALERARDKAQLMATTLGVELGDVVSVEETTAPRYQPMVMHSAKMNDSATPAYRSGEISIEAGVNVTWEIDD